MRSFFSLVMMVYSAQIYCQTPTFDRENDLLLMHFDCKTDVDDVHSAAAFAMLLSHEDFRDIRYHAVAGTYGIQEGLYVPANDLFEKAFGEHWSDAHTNVETAISEVSFLAASTLREGGDIWIADAGQSDFSARLVRSLGNAFTETQLKQHVHIVQHSDWNEEVTSPEDLRFVKSMTDYQKIPDGNSVGNGTPGFRTPEFTQWSEKLSDPELVEWWQLAADIGNRYNGKKGRYLNEAIMAGGLDFSDLAEVCWILGLEDIRDTAAFFKKFGR